MKRKTINLEVPPAFDSLTEDYRYHVFSGSRGSGKSWSVARFLVAAALAKKVKILCAREFQNSISDSVHSLISNVITESGLDSYFDIQNNYITSKNGSEFIFKGLAMNIASIKSIEAIDIVWLEEADRISQNSLDVLIPTVRKPGSFFIITYNPTHEDDPIHKMFYKDKPENALVKHVTFQDNPYFPDVLREEMEHMRATDYDRYEHVWLGKCRTISDAQVFKGKFVVSDFSSEGIEAFYHGMDFGFANDPSTVIKMFIKDLDLYVAGESYGHHIELTDLPPFINKTIAGRGYKILADCARPETISYLANLGYNIRGAKKWQGSVEDGVEFMKSFRQIIIHPACVHTIEEFKRYSYKVDKRTNEVLPIIAEGYDHCIDAIRYGLDDLIKKKTTIYDVGVMG